MALTQATQVVEPDLARLAAGTGWTLTNRAVSAAADEGRRAVRFDERAGQGVALLEGLQFETGEIEVDIKGQDVPQRSFVGVAFHALDNAHFDAVYFRPFNFRATDPVRHGHAVQYESEPDFGWQRLRSERPEQYEHAVAPAPDPNRWFHARVVVRDRKVRVFVDGAAQPSLEVDALTDRRRGRVGLWVGEMSGGMFANVKIRPDAPAGRR